MVVAQVQDLNVVVEFEQVAKLGRVLQAVELVVCQVQLPQVHVHLQGRRCNWWKEGVERKVRSERREKN